MTREEVAWAIGFFEGEGSVGTFRRPGGNGKQRLGIQVQVWNTDPEPLERFQAAIGFGRVKGPYKNGGRFAVPPGGFKEKYAWAVAGFEQAQAFIAIAWPLLSHRRRQQAYDALIAYHQYKALP